MHQTENNSKVRSFGSVCICSNIASIFVMSLHLALLKCQATYLPCGRNLFKNVVQF